MWKHHLWNLISQSWGSLLSNLSMSTLSVIILSFTLPVLVFVTVSIYNAVQARKSGIEIKEILKTSVIPSFISAGLTMFVWIILFGWSVAATIYKDHQDLVSYIPKVQQKQAAHDQQIIGPQKQEIAQLKKQIPKLNPQCWMQSIPLRAPRIPEIAQSESEAVIVCNTELKAPRTMTVYYDQQPTGYGLPIVLPEKTGHWGLGILRDKSLTVTLTAGSIGSYQAFVVPVDGANTTAPVATKFEIR